MLLFRPDVVVLQHTINDSHVPNYLQPEHPRLNAWIHRSTFFVWALKRVLYSEFGLNHLYERIGSRWPDLLLFEVLST